MIFYSNGSSSLAAGRFGVRERGVEGEVAEVAWLIVK